MFFFQAEDGIRDYKVTGVQTCALPISTILTLPNGRGSAEAWLAPTLNQSRETRTGSTSFRRMLCRHQILTLPNGRGSEACLATPAESIISDPHILSPDTAIVLHRG